MNVESVMSTLITEFQKMSKSSKSKKRSKFESEFENVLDATATSPDGTGHTFAKLLSLLCKNLTAFFAADTNSFI